MRINNSTDFRPIFHTRHEADRDLGRDFARPSWLPGDEVLQWPASVERNGGEVRRGVERPDPLTFSSYGDLEVLDMCLWVKGIDENGHIAWWAARPGNDCMSIPKRLALMDEFETFRAEMKRMDPSDD